MKKHNTPGRICFLLFLFVLAISSNGQQVAVNAAGKSTGAAKGQPRLLRTHGIESAILHCALQDKNGNLWFSIEGEGAYRYNGTSFKNFTTKDGLVSNAVGPVIQDRKGNIIFGTKKGICKYDGRIFSRYPQTDTLSITCLLEDRNGNLWFGTMGNGVYCYDGKKLVNYLNNQRFNLGNRHQVILDILQDRNGNLWFSSWNGGGVWRYDGKSFENFLPSADYYKSNEDQRSSVLSTDQRFSYMSQVPGYGPQDHITDDMIFSITEDKAGNLWFATRRHGACRYDGKSFTSFREHEGFVSYGVYSVLQDQKGNLWFTTEKNGVFCYNGKTFKNFTVNDGLVSNSVLSVLEDKNGNLWFGTKWFGLSRYDGKKMTTFSGEGIQ